MSAETKEAPTPVRESVAELEERAERLAEDRAPEDLTPELDAVDLDAPADQVDDLEDGDGVALADPERTRQTVRATWLAVSSTLEMVYGPAMRHSSDEVDALTECWVPVAEAYGIEWLGDWVLIVGAIGGTAAIEAPKFRKVYAGKKEADEGGNGRDDSAHAPPPAPEDELEDEPAPAPASDNADRPRTRRGPAPEGTL